MKIKNVDKFGRVSKDEIRRPVIESMICLLGFNAVWTSR
jgi:hypothetical protein